MFEVVSASRQTVIERNRRSLLLVAAAHGVASVALAVFFPRVGSIAGIFGLGAVIVAALCFGLRLMRRAEHVAGITIA
jgi:LDH2 family malate/lactate/ureidoglycolate dehydrogenase